MKTHYIYLGGNHLDDDKWRNHFNNIASTIKGNSFNLKGIDPFFRNINENDNVTIVERDIAILHDKRLTHVVLKSFDHGSLLSTGTSFECLIANILKKPVIIIGEPDLKKKLKGLPKNEKGWHHPFVQYFTDSIVNSIEDAINWIVKDIASPVKKESTEKQLDDISKKYLFDGGDINPFNE